MTADTKKPLPIRAVWLGPPESRMMVNLRANLFEEGIEVDHRGYIDGVERIPKDTQVVLVLDGAVRGSLMRKVKALAEDARLPIVQVSPNAKRAATAVRNAGIKPPVVAAAPAPAPAPLKVPVMEIVRTPAPTVAAAPTPTPAPPRPLPSFVIPNDLGPKRGRMIERRYRTLRVVIDVLSTGPVWLEEMRAALRDSGVVETRDAKSLTINTLHWLRDAGMAQVVEGGATDAGGHTYRWALTDAPHDDAAIAKELARRMHEGEEAQRAAARARGTTQPIPPEERDAPSPSKSALSDKETAELFETIFKEPDPVKPWRMVRDARLDAWCDPNGRKAVRK